MLRPSHSNNNRNRGQVLIISALLLSLIVLGSVAYMNSASITSQKQAGGATDYGDETRSTILNVRYDVENAIRHINFDNESYTTEAEKATALENTINDLDRVSDAQYASQLTTVSLTYESYESGTRLTQQEFSNLTSPSGNSWTMITDSTKTRSFSLSFNGDTVPNESTPFGVVIDTVSGESYTYEIYSTSSNNLTIENTSNGATNGPTKTFPINDTHHPVVSFSQQTVDGERWDELPPTNNITTVSLENSQTVSARFDVVTGSEGNTHANGQAYDNVCPGPSALCDGESDTDSGDLTEYPAIYSADVTVQVNTPVSSMETTITVEPRLGYTLEE